MRIFAQASPAEEVALESAAPITSAVPADQALSILELVADASLTVQLVMLSLLLASVLSWVLIMTKFFMLRRESRLTEQFEKQFWSGGSMKSLYAEFSHGSKNACGLSDIFVAGFNEYQRLSERGAMKQPEALSSIERAMRVELNREIDMLDAQIPILATIGSSSPYVGLFGTVWGIMNSFRALGVQTQQATVASVAPGIAEALIATAMGLFAAIPAVIAYNRFANRVERLIGRYEIFMEEFISEVNRQVLVESV